MKLKMGLRLFGVIIALLSVTGSGMAMAGSTDSALQQGASQDYTALVTRFFSETGKTVQADFLDYWEQNGALSQIGYPISNEFQETSDLNGKTYTVQYFERSVLEKHPENNPPYNVLLSQLGTFRYKALYGAAGAPNQIPDPENSRFFPQTGKIIGSVFRAYWEQHGGLPQQGYPISDEFYERSPLDGNYYLVQYFERAVFELHPENKPPYNVLLSQLGKFQLKQKYPAGSSEAVAAPVVSLQAYCLLGGGAGTTWVQPEGIVPQVKGGEKYNLYGLNGTAGTATGGAATSAGDPCEDTQTIDINTPAGAGTATLAIGGPWNAQPRLPKSESVNQDVYRQATADLLAERGIPDATVGIKQILRVDLEGDGDSEVLVTATHYANTDLPEVSPGDYSVVYLRKVVNGKVLTTVLGGEFYAHGSEFAAPNTYSVSAVADVNGDGVMEVILYSSYYEGNATVVMQVDGAKVQEVLACGCGA